jgi:hypothetical protein
MHRALLIIVVAIALGSLLSPLFSMRRDAGRMSTQDVIRLLHLEPLDFEGGYFRQTYISDEFIPESALPDRYKSPKPFGTAIYFMLTNDTQSALHRLPTDEVYHFYMGGPVEMLLLYQDGSSEVIILGNDLSKGQRPQFVVPKGTWQGSVTLGSWSLLGTTMAPGFEDSDFEGGTREGLLEQYPEQRMLIERLTPPFTD